MKTLAFDIAPYRTSGTVYGTLLNQRAGLDALGPSVHEAPYKAPPKAPVLYVKPRNTLALPGDPVEVPAGVPELEVGAALGIVIGRTACRISPSEAFAHIAGYTIVNDVSVPHTSFYRPSIRFKARDGFCPMGPCVVPQREIADPDTLTVDIFVDGALRLATSTAGMVRPVAALMADVTEFMTLRPGDVLMLGVVSPAPRVRGGQHVVIEIEGIGRLENTFVGEQA